MNLKKNPHRTGYAGEEGAQGCAGAEMVITSLFTNKLKFDSTCKGTSFLTRNTEDRNLRLRVTRSGALRSSYK